MRLNVVYKIKNKKNIHRLSVLVNNKKNLLRIDKESLAEFLFLNHILLCFSLSTLCIIYVVLVMVT